MKALLKLLLVLLLIILSSGKLAVAAEKVVQLQVHGCMD
jgi:hypothetical protein